MTTPTQLVDGALVAAAEHVEAGRLAEALAALLETWQTVALAPLADAIEALGKRVCQERPADISGKSADARQRWQAQAEARQADQLDGLLGTWHDVPGADAAARAQQLLAWPSDPRRDAAVLAVLHITPYRTTAKFWTQLYALAEAVRDPRQLEALRAIPALHAEVLGTTQGGRRIAERVAKIVETIAPRIAADAPEVTLGAAALRALESLTAPAPTTEHASRVDELHAQVLGRPDELELRAVYADALAEQGDPRAELISLSIQQHETPLDKAQRARIKALLKAHLPALLGPLDQVVYRRDLELRCGFLERCIVNTERPQLVEDVVGHPMWATVVDLSGPAQIFLHPVMRSLRRLRLPSRLRGQPELAALLAAPHPPAIELLEVVVRPATVETIGDAGEKLPSLRHLRALSCNAEPRALLDAPICQQLQSLWIELPWLWQRWVKALHEAPCAADEVTLFAKHDGKLAKGVSASRGYVELRFERGPSGLHDQVADSCGRSSSRRWPELRSAASC